jgi:hypothetical protein
MSPIHQTFHSNSTQIAPTPPEWIIGVFGGSVSEVECLKIKTPLGFRHTLTCSIELHSCPLGTPNIHYLYTKINLIKLCVVESNGVWWNGTCPIPPYID